MPEPFHFLCLILNSIVMAIYTDRILMDIHRMIKKGSVQFEPEDRIPIVFANKDKGREMTLYLGSVYYDSSTFKVCYDLYNHADSASPVGALNPREIEKLSAGDLVAVADRLEEYERDSVLRYSNYKMIEQALSESASGSIDFQEGTRPRVLAAPEPGIATTNVAFAECRAVAVFMDRPGNDCYVSVIDNAGKSSNVKLAMLNDRSIMNIASCMKNIRKQVQEAAQRNVKGVTF